LFICLAAPISSVFLIRSGFNRLKENSYVKSEFYCKIGTKFFPTKFLWQIWVGNIICFLLTRVRKYNSVSGDVLPSFDAVKIRRKIPTFGETLSPCSGLKWRCCEVEGFTVFARV
jgi:hypothetical protein